MKSSAVSDTTELLFLTSFVSQAKLKNLPKEIDEPILTIEKIRLNALAFCLISGNYKNFVYLIEKLNASVSTMELLFEQQGFHGLDILIEKNSVELLNYYFPVYKTLFPQRFFADEDLDTSDSMGSSKTFRKLPIHIATERGHLATLQFFQRQFQSRFTPYKYNLHYIDEHSGENPALIACKNCHLEIVKFLHEECKADFDVKSKRLESALHLAAFGSKSKKKEGFAVVQYLVDVVKIDVGFQYEEILLILDDPEIIKYVEKKLKTIGIYCTKSEVEKKYSISTFSEWKNKVLYGNAFEFSGPISSIDATLTVNVSSFFQELDSN